MTRSARLPHICYQWLYALLTSEDFISIYLETSGETFCKEDFMTMLQLCPEPGVDGLLKAIYEPLLQPAIA